MLRKIPILLRSFLLLMIIYIGLKVGVRPPLPSSLFFMLMPLFIISVLLYVSVFEQTLREFIDPILLFFRGDQGESRFVLYARWAFLGILPLLVGGYALTKSFPSLVPPISSRVIHPAPPPEVAAFYNEFRDDETNLKKYIEEGEVIYFQNCFFCHGDALDGEGHFAHGINPAPADFQDPGTIAQLTESFVFWRISTGGPGLPDESTPWDSFMPRWETILTKEERWKVILYLYDLTGWSPRTWGEEEAHGEFEEVEEEKEEVHETETVEKGAEKKGDLESIRKLYEKRCAPCHGKNGEGDGPATGFLVPRPRDFTWGMYKFRSTISGFTPTDEDLFRTIRQGLPGTGMPAWKELTDEEIKALVQYIKAFAPDEFEEGKAEPIQIGTPPEASPELIERGKKLFQEVKCFECHGQKGRGDTMKELKDEWSHIVFPRNLTHTWEYRRGSALEDIFERVSTGIDGTPMPSFKDAPFSLSDEDRWALAHYVRTLQLQRKTGLSLLAKLVEKLPSDPDDPLWDSVEYLDIPMVGQVVAEPRMFSPRVDNVRVQALYDNKDVVFRLVWDDITESKPDPTSKIFEDAVAIQFPVTVPTGSKRPYFLMGDADNPVHLWHWGSERSGATELNAKGAKQIQAQSESGQQVTANLKYDAGQYRLVFKRSLSTPDLDLDVQLAPGQFIPMSFFAWDGTNNETGMRSSLSSWYFVLLEPTTEATVYLYPFVMILVMGGAEWWFISRLRKNKEGGV